MKKTPYYIYTLLAIVCLALPVKAAEQEHVQSAEADSTATGHYVHQIAVDLMPGLILHTNDFLRGSNPEVRTMNHNTGFRLKYAFSAPEQSEEARIFRDAYQGIGIGYNDFNPQLGNPLSVFLLQGARIASLSNCLSLNYEWNLGLAFGWHPYNEETNPDNKVIGSRVTAYIGLDFYLRWIMSRHVDLNLGVGVAHYSNGNTQYPNLGLNTAFLNLGASCYIGRKANHLLHRHEVAPPVSHDISYDLIVYGAWRQRGGYENGYPFLLNGKTAVVGFNFNPMYRLNHWLKLGASLDGTYDRTANIYYDVDYIDPDYNDQYRRPSTAKQMTLGMSARAEFTMPYFAINFGIGKNFLNTEGEFGGMYEVLALKINITRRSLLHIGYSLNDFHTPKHLMLGVGWRFGKISTNNPKR
ncbi:MAG: acyloxyacyl hydrolase [Prevotella sp.]|uniref:acyloxyacyl hydrolase n=1 Tax=Prevotella sp. TaxID=59823 RepID=UPI0025CC399A|nr:acyloxyacyl hydrolase [Prevotella sp.]MCI7119635.1 acyloxyacyl hydrolase [Prevotella sp.]